MSEDDLVVEVLSPRPRIGETDERVGWFAEYGVRECWLVNQDDVSIDVLKLSLVHGVQSRRRFLRNDPIRSTVFPEFNAPLLEILDD